MTIVVTTLIAVVIGVLVLWLILIVGLAFTKPSEGTIREAMRLLPDVIRLVRNLSRDQSIGRGPRVRLALLLAYLAFPIDVVPDFLPVIGFADDAIVISLVLRNVIKHVGTDRVRAHWPGTQSGFDVVSRLCRLPGDR